MHKYTKCKFVFILASTAKVISEHYPLNVVSQPGTNLGPCGFKTTTQRTLLPRRLHEINDYLSNFTVDEVLDSLIFAVCYKQFLHCLLPQPVGLLPDINFTTASTADPVHQPIAKPESNFLNLLMLNKFQLTARLPRVRLLKVQNQPIATRACMLDI